LTISPELKKKLWKNWIFRIGLRQRTQKEEASGYRLFDQNRIYQHSFR
jgi:hypothetical protein